MQLILPFPEALELVTAEKPLPAPIEHVSCVGTTVFVQITPESVLPRFLRAAAPKVKLELRFLTFRAGVAIFELVTNVLSLPVHRLLNFLTDAIPLPEGVRIEKGESTPRLVVNVQKLIDEQVSGLSLDEFYLHEGEVVVLATLQNFRTKPSPQR